jgi:two-component system nitrate/nitrite response regulator NarL
MVQSSVTGPGHLAALPAIAVLVVDDQQAVREGLARLIACAPLAWRAIETAAAGTHALRTAISLRPDVVILDADLSGEDGLALIPLLAPAAVLVLTCHGDRATRERALRLGARAFVEKHQPAAELLDALVQMVGPQTRGEEAPAYPGASAHRAAVASSAAQRSGVS